MPFSGNLIRVSEENTWLNKPSLFLSGWRCRSEKGMPVVVFSSTIYIGLTLLPLASLWWGCCSPGGAGEAGWALQETYFRMWRSHKQQCQDLSPFWVSGQDKQERHRYFSSAHHWSWNLQTYWVLRLIDEPQSLPIAPGSSRALPEEMCIIVQDYVWYTQPGIAKEQGPRLNIKTDLENIAGHFLSYLVCLLSMLF